MKRILFSVLMACGLWLMASLPPASACPVCYGDLEPDQARGFFWGIVLLIALPPLLIGYIAGHVIYQSRRKARADALIERAESFIQPSHAE